MTGLQRSLGLRREALVRASREQRRAIDRELADLENVAIRVDSAMEAARDWLGIPLVAVGLALAVGITRRRLSLRGIVSVAGLAAALLQAGGGSRRGGR